MAPRERRRNREAGGAILEFAFSLALGLTVLFGIIDIGRALYAYDWVSNAARIGTRFAMVRGALTCQKLPGGCPATADDVTNYLKGMAVGIDTGKLTVTTKCYVTANIASDPPCAPRTWVNVRVLYTFEFVSPFIPLSWDMKSTSQVVVQH